MIFSKKLWVSLFAAYGGPYTVAAGLKVLQDLLAFLQPQLLRLFLAFIARYQAAKYGSSKSLPREPTTLETFVINKFVSLVQGCSRCRILYLRIMSLVSDYRDVL